MRLPLSSYDLPLSEWLHGQSIRTFLAVYYQDRHHTNRYGPFLDFLLSQRGGLLVQGVWYMSQRATAMWSKSFVWALCERLNPPVNYSWKLLSVRCISLLWAFQTSSLVLGNDVNRLHDDFLWLCEARLVLVVPSSWGHDALTDRARSIASLVRACSVPCVTELRSSVCHDTLSTLCAFRVAKVWWIWDLVHWLGHVPV